MTLAVDTMLFSLARQALVVGSAGLFLKIVFGILAAIFLIACGRLSKKPATTSHSGRRFQFRTTSLLAALVAVAVVLALGIRASKWSSLEGTWHGSGSSFAGHSLVIDLDQMTLVGHGRAETFRCVFPHDTFFFASSSIPHHNGFIDLYGPNGVQHGLFSISYGDQLKLQLANPGEPRPKEFGEDRTGLHSQFYDFDRDR